MSGAARYILRVTAAAVLNGVAQCFPLEGSMRGMVKLVGGVLMAMTLISPLLTLRLPDMSGMLSDYAQEGQSTAAMGAEMADDAMRAFIKKQTEAYILDKAAAMDAVLTADVETNEAGVPAAVTLAGDVAPETKARLARIIASELGIGKEAQRWIG